MEQFKIRITIIIALLFTGLTAEAQVDTLLSGTKVTFNEYMELVRSGNLRYAAEKMNVTVSEAGIEAAKAFPDPYVSFGMDESKESGIITGHNYSSEIGTTIEIGGKRRARIDLARSENELTKALLADFFRNLQADAALLYLDAVKQKQLLRVSYDSWVTMKRLSDADSIRFALGSIMHIDAIQSRLEAGILFNGLQLSIAEWKNSLLRVQLMAGDPENGSLLNPASPCLDSCRLFSLDMLIAGAIENRTDLIVAMYDSEVAIKAYKLARRERIPDIDLSVGATNSYITGVGTPASTGIGGGIEIPLKFSNIYRGTTKMAKAKIEQTVTNYDQAELEIKTEVTEAWNLYYNYCRQVENFEDGLLKLSSDVLNGKIYSYQRGETSLLEVLNAQRTYNDIQTSYFETRFNRAAALINLERAAGFWDISF